MIAPYQAEQLRCLLAFLEEREVENGIAWTTVSKMLENINNPPEEACPTIIHAVDDNERILALGLWTPPHPLLVSVADPSVLHRLAQSFADMPEHPKMVLGTAEASAHFARVWQGITEKSPEISLSMVIYKATAFVLPTVDGASDYAHMDDLETLYNWSQQSANETNPGIAGADRDTIRSRIIGRTVQVWRTQHGQAVSTAAEVGRTRNGARISGVYTPPELRGRGHASACTASVTRSILESGCQFAYLYADAENPQANRVYQRIGFRRVSKVHTYRL